MVETVRTEPHPSSTSSPSIASSPSISPTISSTASSSSMSCSSSNPNAVFKKTIQKFDDPPTADELPVSRMLEVSQTGESGSRLDYILSHVDSISDSIYEPSALSCSRGFRSPGPEPVMAERRALLIGCRRPHSSTTSGPIRMPGCKPQI